MTAVPMTLLRLLCQRAGDDQYAPQDILPQARCCHPAWVCSAEGILGSKDLWKARQVRSLDLFTLPYKEDFLNLHKFITNLLQM